MKTFLRASLMVALATGFMALAGSAAKAGPVTFSSSGIFTCAACVGSGTGTVTFGGAGNTLTLAFNNLVNAAVNTDPLGFTFTSFGSITTSATGTGATITPGTVLTLSITQTVPTPGGPTPFSGTLSGIIDGNTSSGQILFTVTSLNINGVVYDIVNNPLALVPPSTNNGVTSIQGRITTPGEIPEPASMLLLGTGLVGLAGAARRRFRSPK